jgi:hypothetical protein
MDSLPSDTTTQPRRSRRALLAGALGGLGAVAAGAIARVHPTRAADGDPVLIGADNVGTMNTTLTTTDISAFRGSASDISAEAVVGTATSATGFTMGVRGVSESSNGTGVDGQATATSGQTFGVIGSTASPMGTGVSGHGDRRGVQGFSSSGHAIHGETNSGWAGWFDGRVFTNRYIELAEIANPTAPGGNRARLFLRENASGTQQLCVRFANGTIRVLASA